MLSPMPDVYWVPQKSIMAVTLLCSPLPLLEPSTGGISPCLLVDRHVNRAISMLWKNHSRFSGEELVSAGSLPGFWLKVGSSFPGGSLFFLDCTGWVLRQWPVADFQSPAPTPNSNVTSSVKPSLSLFLPLASRPGRPGRMSHFLCTRAALCPLWLKLLYQW